MNPAFTGITGYEKEDVIGKKPNVLQSGKQSDDFYTNLWQNLNEQGEWQGEMWNRHKDGSLIAEWPTIHAIRDEAGEVNQYVGMFSDITDQKKGR
ncbi:PAS domain-containing protein [Salicibibacter cibarius]|uniref:PAS domain-containing protein n=1 Tax=Salicibibacter cibarius TaxID=2743000 RepID=UPI001FE6F7DA|nr:PAS domain S-box protein [Salicibibacter cibarius]